MRVVVVGATGNVGTAILTRFQNEPGVELVGVARRAPRDDAPPYVGVEWHALDVGVSGAVERLTPVFEGADAVVCVAWALQPNHDERRMHRTDVTGTRHVAEAAARAGVPQFVYASSVGTYAESTKRVRRDESWPATGLASSVYSRHKAINEEWLDAFQLEHPEVVVSRLRPGLVLQQGAAAEIIGLFAGRRVPTRWLQRATPPILPLSRRFVSQVVHATDLAEAFWRVVDLRAGGAFNIATEPVVDPALVAGVLDTRTIPFPYRALRLLVSATWRLRVQPTDPGWVDIAAKVPVMSTERARTILGWSPKVPADAAVAAMVVGIAERSNVESSPALRG
ncbi:NAD-dependent epimerase/dehydratase family protein [Frondihabitans peucedani]|uniref:NAD-dependent epimerase/dehydratase family protein n=1 Tax=Frondihabitans peucedani TaxID=598626 RepID=A0ABP8DYN1_9MICO